MSVNRKYLRDKIANALLIGDDAIEISRLCLALLDEVDVLDDDLENTRMRLIACQCVAEANTREGAKNMRDVHEAWQSPAFHSVCAAVDREIDLREKLEAAKARESRLVMADAGEAIKIAEDAASQALDCHIGEPAWQVSPRAVSIIRAALLSSLESSGWVIVPTEALK